jgi:branched-chain amino acid transport system ATP-binding protein
MADTILKVSGLEVSYGGIHAVKGIDFHIDQGELVTLIGANGAGKTTTLKAITGLLPVKAGEISYRGENTKGRPTFKLLRDGLAMVPEGRGVFTRMSITENLLMGAYIRDDEAGIRADIDKMFGIFPRLKERANQLAGTMSGGEQQMLALSRAFLSRPSVVLVDEASMGLAPKMVDQIFDVLGRLASDGISVLIVEQYARRALELADYAYVLSRGEVVLSGSTREIAYADVAATYLS